VRAEEGSLPYAFQRVGEEFQLSLGLTNYYYYSFLYTPDLLQSYGVIKMALGNPAPTFGYTPGTGELRGFFKGQANDIFAPGDFDGDGIDDIWELKNRLNPLNSADARLRNLIDPTKTNLQYYLNRYKKTVVKEFYSREVTFDNHQFAFSKEISLYNVPPVAGASLEAISGEVSLYNFPTIAGVSAEAFSDEISVYNIPPAPMLSVDVQSAEVSVFNGFAVALASVEAISDEVSLFNGPASGSSVEAISDEVSVQNTPATFVATTEAISKEVSLFNSAGVTGPSAEAISDEVTVFNGPTSAGPSVDAISDEVTVYNTPASITATVEAISKEVAVFNAAAVIGPSVEAISDEVSVFNIPPGGIDQPTLSREVSVLNTIQ
jgi:hypothetical protein